MRQGREMGKPKERPKLTGGARWLADMKREEARRKAEWEQLSLEESQTISTVEIS